MFLDELFTLGAGCGWLGDITSCRPWRPVRPTTRKSHREHAAKGHESFPVVKWMIPLRHRHTESLTGTTYLWKTKSRLPVPPHRFPDVAGPVGCRSLMSISWTLVCERDSGGMSLNMSLIFRAHPCLLNLVSSCTRETTSLTSSEVYSRKAGAAGNFFTRFLEYFRKSTSVPGSWERWKSVFIPAPFLGPL